MSVETEFDPKKIVEKAKKIAERSEIFQIKEKKIVLKNGYAYQVSARFAGSELGTIGLYAFPGLAREVTNFSRELLWNRVPGEVELLAEPVLNLDNPVDLEYIPQKIADRVEALVAKAEKTQQGTPLE